VQAGDLGPLDGSSTSEFAVTASAAAADPVAEPGADPGPDATPAALHAVFLENAAVTNWILHRLTVLIRRMESCAGYTEHGCPTRDPTWSSSAE
jgi:hypothetical protein